MEISFVLIHWSRFHFTSYKFGNHCAIRAAQKSWTNKVSPLLTCAPFASPCSHSVIKKQKFELLLVLSNSTLRLEKQLSRVVVFYSEKLLLPGGSGTSAAHQPAAVWCRCPLGTVRRNFPPELKAVTVLRGNRHKRGSRSFGSNFVLVHCFLRYSLTVSQLDAALLAISSCSRHLLPLRDLESWTSCAKRNGDEFSIRAWIGESYLNDRRECISTSPYFLVKFIIFRSFSSLIFTTISTN